MRRLRFVLQPGWMALHAVTVALAVAVIMLGGRQLAESKSLGDALQWWALGIIILGIWARSICVTYRTTPSVPAAVREGPSEPIIIRRLPAVYRRYVMPPVFEPTEDPLHNAYNDYLALIAASDLASADLTVPDIVRHASSSGRRP